MPLSFSNWNKSEGREKPGDLGNALHSSIPPVAMESNSFKGIFK